MSKTILFTGEAVPGKFEKKLVNLGHTVLYDSQFNFTEDELIKVLKGVNGYLLGGEEKATARVLEKSKESLEIVAYFGAGHEKYVDLEAATKHGIAVSNTPAANSRSVAEFTLGLILSAVKKIPYLVNQTKIGNVITEQTWNLHGGTIGIIGMGAIGSKVAYIAHNGFGMHVLYVSRTTKSDVESALGAQKVELDELLSKSDVVSLHAPLSAKNIDMIGEKEFSLMKPHAILVNTSRAELVNPLALQEALAKKKIGGAAFDVYYNEPIPSKENDPYRLIDISEEHFILTPHTAFRTQSAFKLMLEMNVNSIISVFDSNPDQNVLNPEVVKNLDSKSFKFM